MVVGTNEKRCDFDGRRSFGRVNIVGRRLIGGRIENGSYSWRHCRRRKQLENG
jgi:hypothetical protein